MLYLNTYNLFHRCSVNILQDIQNFPNHSNKHLNPQRKFPSADSTGHLNRRCLKVNKANALLYCWLGRGTVHTVHDNAEKIKEHAKLGTPHSCNPHTPTVAVAYHIII
jgi:hypothetical protein